MSDTVIRCIKKRVGYDIVLDMGWKEKDQPTSFDNLVIPGLQFVDGDILAEMWGIHGTKGQKFPEIVFPSGVNCQLWETTSAGLLGIVHLYGEMDLPLGDTRDRAFEQADDIAQQCGYIAKRVGENELEVWGRDTDEHYRLIYDNEVGRMVDVIQIKDEPSPQELFQMELLPDEIREQLPPLYANEKIGLKANAIVKYFTPDANWTWYGSEFDRDDIFFGLVSGFEVELGYFSLSELKTVRGSLGLPIERDLYFEPTTLEELMKQHRQGD